MEEDRPMEVAIMNDPSKRFGSVQRGAMESVDARATTDSVHEIGVQQKPYKKRLLISYRREMWYCLLCPKDPSGNRVILYDVQDTRRGLVAAIEDHMRRVHQLEYDVASWHADSEQSTFSSTSDLATGEWRSTQTATFVLPDQPQAPAVLHILTAGANRA